MRKLDSRVLPLLIVLFIDSVGFGIIYPVLTPLVLNNLTLMFPAGATLELRTFWFETIVAVYCFAMFLGAPILGTLSDKYGRKKILMLAMAGCAVGFIICGIGAWLNSLWILLFGRVIAGLTSGSFPIGQAAMMDISTPEERPQRIGWIGLASGLGFACGPMIGGFLIEQFHDYFLPFWFSAALALFGVLSLVLLFKEEFATRHEIKLDILTGFHNIKEAFTHAKTRICFFALLVYFTGYVLFFSIIPVFAVAKFKVNSGWVGYFMSYFGIIFTIGLMGLLPIITKYFSLKKMAMGSILVQPILYLLFAYAPNVYWLWILAAPISIAIPFAYIGIVTLLANETSNEEQGKLMGVVGSVMAVCWFLGPELAGISAKWFFTAPFMVAIVLVLTAALILWAHEQAE